MQLDYSGMLIRAAVPHLVWFVPALVAVAALKALLPRLSGWIGERRVSAKLKRLFPAVRHDLILPDGRGGLTQLDHLALTPGGLLVVETKTYSGIILGQGNESTWTQVIGRRRHSFQNPLRQNYAHARALEALAPDIPIEGRVVFAGTAQFPKGMPEGVCHVSELASELASLRHGEVSAPLREAWGRVLAAARTDRAARKEHLRGLQARHGAVRSTWVPMLLFAVSALWLSGLWLDHRPVIHRPGAKTTAATPTQDLVTAALAPLLRDAGAPSVRAPVGAPQAPSGTAQGATPALSRAGPTKPPERTAAIEWAAPGNVGSDDNGCALATAAVLIDNTAEKRRARGRACASTGTR